jgi:hypothetical protein
MRFIGTLVSFGLVFALGLASGAANHKKHIQGKTNTKVKKDGAVNIDFALELNGQVIAHPHVEVALGEKGTIMQPMEDHSSYTIEVTPTKPKAGEIQMTFAVSHSVNGRVELVGSPQIIILDGDKARIEQKSSNGQTMSIEATAKL